MEKEESKRIEIEDGGKEMEAYHREGERRGSDEQRELDGRTRKIDRRGEMSNGIRITMPSKGATKRERRN